MSSQAEPESEVKRKRVNLCNTSKGDNRIARIVGLNTRRELQGRRVSLVVVTHAASEQLIGTWEAFAIEQRHCYRTSPAAVAGGWQWGDGEINNS